MHNHITRMYESLIEDDFALRHEIITHADGHTSSPFKARVKESIKMLRAYRQFLKWASQRGYLPAEKTKPDVQGTLF